MFERFKNWIMKFKNRKFSILERFSKVVYIKTPLSTLAFVTKELDHFFIVFIPISPSPTAGFTLIVKKEDCKEIDITIKEALEFFISFGFASPKEMDEKLMV